MCLSQESFLIAEGFSLVFLLIALFKYLFDAGKVIYFFSAESKYIRNIILKQETLGCQIQELMRRESLS